jgi:hypothetical protein
MIRFSLACNDGHRFDSWFASSAAYEGLLAAGHVTCAICGSAKVEKALMAPAVRTDHPEAAPVSPEQGPPSAGSHGPLSQPAGPAEQALAAFRKKLEAEADYVGPSFAAEARAIHDGTAPERMIYGEARLDEAKSLIDDGIPVAPMPFLPKNRAN